MAKRREQRPGRRVTLSAVMSEVEAMRRGLVGILSEVEEQTKLIRDLALSLSGEPPPPKVKKQRTNGE